MTDPAHDIAPAGAVDWQTSSALVAYEDALADMESRAQAIYDGMASQRVWLVEHPPLYTAGTSAQAPDLLDPRFPVYESGRGGQYTYHGPGQRVAYVQLDLSRRGRDLRRYVHDLEEWLIIALAKFGVRGVRREDRVGIWVDLEPFGHAPGSEAKIAAIGVRVRRWVTLHGVAINVNPDLDHFSGIVPCGVADHGVTSLADLGIGASLSDMDDALIQTWPLVFG